jgi:hypothetical protein
VTRARRVCERAGDQDHTWRGKPSDDDWKQKHGWRRHDERDLDHEGCDENDPDCERQKVC